MLVPLQKLIEDFSLVNANYFLDPGLKYLVLPSKHSNLKVAERRSSKKVLGFSFFSVSMKRRAYSVV